MEKGEADGEEALVVTVWPEPYGFDATPEEQKTRARFAFSEEGIEAGVQWLNEMRTQKFSGGEE